MKSNIWISTSRPFKSSLMRRTLPTLHPSQIIDTSRFVSNFTSTCLVYSWNWDVFRNHKCTLLLFVVHMNSLFNIDMRLLEPQKLAFCICCYKSATYTQTFFSNLLPCDNYIEMNTCRIYDGILLLFVALPLNTSLICVHQPSSSTW